MNGKKILIVDDDPAAEAGLRELLAEYGFQTARARTLRQAAQQLGGDRYDLVITEANLPDGNGLALLKRIRADYPHIATIFVTAAGTIQDAVKAIKAGACDYLTKPITETQLVSAVQEALKERSQGRGDMGRHGQSTGGYGLENIISQDYKMAKIFELVAAVADTTTTVLMTGPSGTGKSLLARAIHQQSARRDGPFVEVSCGALPESLLESELFGHVRGAFTGAVSNKQGKFLVADGGTIFLDEISNASPALQAKLLRVLEDRQFEPVGSNKTITVDTRVILATNQDIEALVAAGRFREDLYYRINVVTIELPPLAERPGDIRLLAQHFLKQYCAEHKRQKLGIAGPALRCLERYDWPGNVRQLQNVIERAVLLSKGGFVTLEDLPDWIKQAEPRRLHKRSGLRQALAEPERDIIRKALQANHWNRRETAKQLQINRSTLYKKMKRYGLDKEAAGLGLS